MPEKEEQKMKERKKMERAVCSVAVRVRGWQGDVGAANLNLRT